MKTKRLREYLICQSACCKPSTVTCYRLVLERFYDHIALDNIGCLTQSKLRNYFLHICAQPLVAYSKVNYLLAVKKYLQWEVEQGTISEDLLDVLDRKSFPKVPEYLPRPLSSENDHLLQQTLRTSQNPYAPLFLLLRHTGMRISELIHLPVDCVMTTLKGENYLKVPLGKMNNERLVPLTDQVLVWIDTIKATTLKPGRQDQTRLINLSGSVASVYHLLDYQFAKLIGNMTDQNKPVTFHRLRHTYATTLLTGGVGLVSLMKLLGHRRVEMTLRYAKVTPSHLRNEYFKALRVLENQSGITSSKNVGGSSGLYEPSDIIARLTAFITKSSHLRLSQQKNLLRKLRALQRDLTQTSFSQKFKLHLA